MRRFLYEKRRGGVIDIGGFGNVKQDKKRLSESRGFYFQSQARKGKWGHTNV